MLKLERLLDDALLHPSAENIIVLTANRALNTAVHDDQLFTIENYDTPWACGMLTCGGDVMDGLMNYDGFEWVEIIMDGAMEKMEEFVISDGYAIRLSDIVAIGPVGERIYSDVGEVGFSFVVVLSNGVQLIVDNQRETKANEWRRELVEKWKEWNQ